MVEALIFLGLPYMVISFCVACVRNSDYYKDPATEFAIAVLWLPLTIYLLIKLFITGCYRLAKEEFS